MPPTSLSNPNECPSEIGLSRDNIEAILKAYFTARYKLTPGSRQFTFNWKTFPAEVMVTTKRT